MRVTLSALMIAFVAFAATGAPAAEPEKVAVDLSSGEIGGRGLTMAESDKPVTRVHLTARVDKNGEGKGTLVPARTWAKVDKFGFPKPAPARPPVSRARSPRSEKSKLRQMIPRPP